MPPRAEKKQQTRQGLLMAALELMETGRGFCSLSLREVTRLTGLVPAAFYRHFPDMDHLGLALVEEVSQTFRAAIREVRHNEFDLGGAIDASVQIFLTYVHENRRQFLFLAREQFGGSLLVRQAIAEMMQAIASDLAADLELQGRLGHLTRTDLELLSDLVVKTVLSTLSEVLEDSAPEPASRLSPQVRLNHLLRFILVGAKQWRGMSPPADQTGTDRASGTRPLGKA